jgi:hypothetical protein
VGVRALIALVLISVGAAAFFVGRSSVDRKSPRAHAGTYDAGYSAGREDAFSGFDGGWSFGTPYVVILQHGENGVTYRFSRRWPMQIGLEYRACGHAVCSRPIR